MQDFQGVSILYSAFLRPACHLYTPLPHSFFIVMPAQAGIRQKPRTEWKSPISSLRGGQSPTRQSIIFTDFSGSPRRLRRLAMTFYFMKTLPFPNTLWQ